MAERGEVPPLSPELKARIDQMAADFMPQVRAEAWKIFQRAPHALELDELISLGLLGMTQAVNAWPRYCHRNGYDPEATQYLIAYILRRVRGAMLDALRSQDWVTRSARTRAKALRDAGQDQGLTDEQLAEHTGMTVAEVRETVAAVAARPVSLDAEPHDVPAQAGTESQVVVTSILEAAVQALRQYPVQVQAVIALCYYHGMTNAEAADVLGVEEADAARWHGEAITAMHRAMVKAVT
jgi:RNA polymerase sigma factor for flagellar operon FliA